ncbi:MAG: Stealth CR1 domain-containing protein [Reichenbachiella sp.]
MSYKGESIDVVYTWVNGDIPAYIEKCKEYAKELSDVNPERFRDEYDMLKYSIRSLEKYVPWLGNVYIFTQSPQIPDWLDTSHPKIRIVHHEDVFDKEYLPTYNSNVIETYIDKIPGLSDYFLYMNDDFLFGRKTEKEKFISIDGIVNIFGSLFGENLKWRIYEKKNDGFGLGLVEHCPILFKKDWWDAMYKLWPEKTHKLRSNKFRQDDDFMAHKLNRYYGLAYQKNETRAVKLLELKKWQIFHKITTNFSKQKRAFSRLTRVKPYFYCLNDDQGKNPNPEVVNLVQDYLQKTYPDKSSFEK